MKKDNGEREPVTKLNGQLFRKGRCTFVPLPGWTQRWRCKQKDGVLIVTDYAPLRSVGYQVRH